MHAQRMLPGDQHMIYCVDTTGLDFLSEKVREVGHAQQDKVLRAIDYILNPDCTTGVRHRVRSLGNLD